MTDLDPWSVQRVANFGLLNAKVSSSLLVPLLGGFAWL